MREEIVPAGRDGRLHGRLWIGDTSPRGVVTVVHGLGDHGGRYRELAERLVDRRWVAMNFDWPGHGESPGTRGHVDSYDGLLEDIACTLRIARERFPRCPLVLLGHSMGGNLAVNYALRRKQIVPELEDLAGLALCAPMLLPPGPPPRPHIFAAWLTGKVLPQFCIDKPVDTNLLTGDPSRAQAIRDDPLTHSRVSIYLATQLLSQGRWALDRARDIDLPTLITYGHDDELIDRSACEHLAIRIGQRATLVDWADTRHDLFSDTRRDEITDRLIAWLGTVV